MKKAVRLSRLLKFPKLEFCPSCGQKIQKAEIWVTEKTQKWTWCRKCGTHFSVAGQYRVY